YFRSAITKASCALESELKRVDSRLDTLEGSIEEVKSKPFVSREELERVYEELKKVKVRDSLVSDVGIVDELRVYARGIVEKEIGNLGEWTMRWGSWFGTSRRGRVHGEGVKMLTPSFGEPRQCFPLKGGSGYVQVRLRGHIVPEAVTLEHVSKLCSCAIYFLSTILMLRFMHREIEQAVAYDRSSAPKDCRVSGWLEDKDMESETMLFLTEFTYDLDRSNAQTFDVADSARSGLVNTVRLEFTSNHGSSSVFTHLYLQIQGSWS
ncbi:unnamed protein product, partial [Brassica oleracea var. botrytis]|uniref:SUN domain-containing protein n=2 Tax=Brassica oleracea TaxID=3712 RepID=A0A0D3AEL8_BRAOL